MMRLVELQENWVVSAGECCDQTFLIFVSNQRHVPHDKFRLGMMNPDPYMHRHYYPPPIETPLRHEVSILSS